MGAFLIEGGGRPARRAREFVLLEVGNGQFAWRPVSESRYPALGEAPDVLRVTSRPPVVRQVEPTAYEGCGGIHNPRV